MGKRTNIDELLKESFDNFSPETPDVWQGIQQSVQATQATSLTVGAKGVALGIKMIAAVVIVGAAITAYIVATNKAENKMPVEATPITEKPFDYTTHAITNEALEPIASESKKNDERPKVNLDKPKNDQKKLISTQEAVQKFAVGTQTEFIEKEISKPAEAVVGANNTKPSARPQPTTITPKTEQEQPAIQEVLTTNQSPKPIAVNIEPPTIPGSFSPNDDGVNDRYVIVIDQDELYSLVILDKEGKKVFESNDKANTWDGRDAKSGNMCPQGTYQYLFNYQVKGSQSPVYKTGLIGLY
jgi:gliding motility-associated-like protein